MRNLKKILALVLALVMSMSLVVTANAFSDDDAIAETYREAATVLDGLKVLQGRDDGNFDPKANITRAEMAAIIYRIVTTDVEDKQTSIYAESSKLTDLDGAKWAAGYVGFCNNSNLILGYPDGTFQPLKNVTGHEALAMLLRAIGYGKNGEFVGKDWAINTAIYAKSNGLLKNINESTLSQPATREMVAEMAFRALVAENVDWSLGLNYQENGKTLAQGFGLERIEGVVTANEYADLYGAYPMDEGETELAGRTLNTTTDLNTLGESRYAWVVGKNVLYMADTGLNEIYDNEGAEVAKLSKATSLGLSDAEYLVNFGQEGYYTSDWKIKYVVTVDAANVDALATILDDKGLALDADDFDKVDGAYVIEISFKIGAPISEDHLSNIRTLFSIADKHEDGYVTGEVYVGTTSTKDISDEISYKAFKAEYINPMSYGLDSFGTCTNGTWLKVIDNDADGEAEYVLKTIYTLSGVEKVSKSGVITLTAQDEELDGTTDVDDINELDKNIPVVTEDELVAGDVVIYAVIDNQALTSKAEMATAKIDKVNRNTLTATTVDGDEYVESGVHAHDYMDLQSGVRQLAGKTSYDLYLDKYGYLAAFTETSTSGDFVLLTDGFYKTDRSGKVYAAMVWNGEELVDTDITVGGSLFIDHSKDYNDWGYLYAFNNINDEKTDVKTIVASLSEDGTLIPVEQVYNKKQINIIATEDNEIPGKDYLKGDAYYTAANDTVAYDTLGVDKDTAGAGVEVRALSTTVYYYVWQEAGETIVKEYVGYGNIPTLYADDIEHIEDVYAVGTMTDRVSGLGDTNYYTADVVVVEFDQFYRTGAEQVFAYDFPEVGKNVKIESVQVIRADGTNDTVEVDFTKSKLGTYSPADTKHRTDAGLYYMWESNTEGVYIIEQMSQDDIAAAGVYTTGWVATTRGTGKYDYTEIQAMTYAGVADYANTFAGKPEFRILEDSDLYTLSYGVKHGDYIANMNADDMDTVLAERVNYDKKANTWQNNNVLVRNDAKGNIVYAISFANFAADGVTTNLAKDIWNSVKPAPEAPEAPVVGDMEQIALDLVEADRIYKSTPALPAAAKQQALDNVIVAMTKYLQNMADVNTAIASNTDLVADVAGIKAAFESVTTDAYYLEVQGTRMTAVGGVVTRLNAYTADSLTTYAAMAQAKADVAAIDADPVMFEYWATRNIGAGYAAKLTAMRTEIAADQAYMTAADTLAAKHAAWFAEQTPTLKAALFDDMVAYYNTLAASMITDIYADSTVNAHAKQAIDAVRTAQTASDATAVADALAALTAHGTTWTAITDTDLTNATLGAKVMDQINGVLTAAGVSGVTVAYGGAVGQAPVAPALGTTNPSVGFVVVLTKGSATQTFWGSTVSVTNNYSNASLTAAVKAAVEGVAVAAGNSQAIIEGRIDAAIAGFGLTSVTRTVDVTGGVTVGAAIPVTFTGTHATLGEVTFTTVIVVKK